MGLFRCLNLEISGEATAAVASLGVLDPPLITLEGHRLHVALIDEGLQRPLGAAARPVSALNSYQRLFFFCREVEVRIRSE